MKYLSLVAGVCSVSVGFIACSSDDSGGGGTGGSATGGFGAFATGGTGTGGTGTGGVGTGGTGTGGTATGGATGTGGASSCPATLLGQKCTALQSPDPTQDACLKGQCCASLDTCLADAACSSFIACSAACQQGGGTPQVCSGQCQSCTGASATLLTAFNTCMTTCAPADGGTTDAGAGDAATD